MQRTQVYLTDEQRDALDELAEREDVALAELIRRAIDAFLARKPSQKELEEILRRTAGSMPDLEVPPRSEWDRGYG